MLHLTFQTVLQHGKTTVDHQSKLLFCCLFFTPSSAPPTNVLIPTQTLIYENLERVFGLYRGNRFTLSSVHINVCWHGTHSTHGAHGVSSSRKGRMCLDAHGSYHFPVFVVAHFLYS